MELKILLLVSSNIVLSGLGDAKMHLDHPSSASLFKFSMASEPTKNTTEVSEPHKVNLLTLKEKYPSFQNYKRRTSSLEKRISQDISVSKNEDKINKFEDLFTDKINNISFYNHALNMSTFLTNISNFKEDVMKKQLDVVLNKDSSVQIDTTTNKAFFQTKSKRVQKLDKHKKEDMNTANEEILERNALNNTSDGKYAALANPVFHLYNHPTKVTTKLDEVPKANYSDVNTEYRDSNQLRSNGSMFTNMDTNHPSNKSLVKNTECCEGKDSQNIFEVDTGYSERFNKAINEEEKANEKDTQDAEDSKLSINAGNLTHINKQTMKLIEIKQLMLSHFESLNIKQVREANCTISITDTIKSSQNIFELIERLSKLVKIILKAKNAEEEEEPFTFMKNVVERQIDKCNEKYNSNFGMNTTLDKTENNETIMNFIKCININFNKCVKSFGLWLKTRKFYLRPRFKLSRAYKTYERIYVLSCI